jgi:hypothetical protein
LARLWETLPTIGWWECKLVQSFGKIVWHFLKTLNTELPFDPAILLCSIYPTELQLVCWQDICITMFIAARLRIVKIEKQPASKSRWMGKENGVHMLHGYYSAFQNEEILLLQATLMNLESIVLSDIRQQQKECLVI